MTRSMQLFALSVTIAILISVAASQVKGPERRVQNNVVISDRNPKAQIRLPRAAHYVGADRWVLYGIADCELHAFVEDNQQNVQRLYWVQFEGYLTSKPELHHTYDSPRHITISGMDFYVDTWTRSNNEKATPGSDREHIEALITAKAYRMPPGMMYVRLVHLLDPEKRQELMIIYGEDLATTGFSAAVLQKSGQAYDKWPAIESGLIDRAKTKVSITE